MFVPEVVTVYHEIDGAGSYQLLPTGDRYIVGISIQQSGTSSDSWLLCNTSIVAKNYGKDFPFTMMNYYCNSTVTVEKTGQDKASFVVSYISKEDLYNRQIVTVAQPVDINFSTQSATPSAQAMYSLFRVQWISSLMILIALGIITFLLFMKRR